MSIDLTTVSVSLDILTVNVEAGPDSLPLDIQAIEPISIWTTSSASDGKLTEENYKNTSIKTTYADNYQYPHVLIDSEISQKTAIFVNTSNNYEKGIHQDPISVPIDIKGFNTRDTIVKKSIPTSFITDNEVGPVAPDGTKQVFDMVTFNSINNTTKTSHFIKTNLVPIQIKGFNTRSPIIQNLSKVNINISGHTDPTATDLLGAAGAFEMTLTNHTNQVADGSNPLFNELFDTPGTHSWTCPAGVSSVSVVCVGAGGSGGWQWSSGGGGGGGLGWKNNIAVTAGQSYTVVVGDHGGEVANAYNATTGMGGNSYFISTSTVCGFGAGGGGLDYAGNTKSTGHGAHGGGYAGDGGGAGGNGAVGGSWTHGGGGAGGYSGDGASRNTNTSASGGGGGAGQYYSSTYGVGAGGGVGVHGEGTSGTTFADGTGYGGKGGSGGGDGMAGESAERSSSNIWTRSAYDNTTVRNTIIGGQYGGGGGGSGTSRGGGPGGTGAVKLVYKTSGSATLEFPSTNVGEIPTAGTTTTQVSNPIPVFVENPSHTYSRDETINHIFKRLSINTEKNNTSGSSYNTNEIPFIISQTSAGPAMEKYFDRLSLNTCITYPYGSGYSLKETDIYIKNGGFSGSNIKTQVSERLSIVSETDKSSTSPVFCNSISFSFRIKGTDDTEWGHFTDNHIKTMKVLTKFNDPRLTSVSSSSSSSSSEGDSESSGSNGTGPVQTWN